MKFIPVALSEYDECVLLCDWLALAMPWVKEMTHHSPNELCKMKHDAVNMKRIGMSPGFPDYFIAVPKNGYNGLFLEMKKSDKRNHQKSATQDGWISRLKEQGYFATYAYGFDDAKNIIFDYLFDEKETHD